MKRRKRQEARANRRITLISQPMYEDDLVRVSLGTVMMAVGGMVLLCAHGIVAQIGAIVGVIGLAIICFVLSAGYF